MAANRQNEIDARVPRLADQDSEKGHNPAADMGENKGTGKTGKPAAGKGAAARTRGAEAAEGARSMESGARTETDSNVDTGASADVGTLIHEME